MPREFYALTDATKETLTDNVKALAIAWDKSTRWVQRILSEDADDPFAPFLSLYTAVAKAGLSTANYDAELEFVRRRYQRRLSPEAAALSFKAQLHSHNETLEKYVECMEDGRLDLEEIDDLERLLIRERDALNLNLQGLKLMKEKLQSRPLRTA
jgi:hypothetical protein